jgi:hypothetical protein
MVMSELLSLFDEETEVSKVRDFNVHPVSRDEVQFFAEQWHYSKSAGSVLWAYGLYDHFKLLGVVAYNMPTREVCAFPFGEEYVDSVAHMGRLICRDESPRNSESRLIAQSLKMLKEDKPNFRAVITYAAGRQNHLGYVYQATNALYLGTAKERSFYVDQKGNHRSTNKIYFEEALQRGWTIHHDPPKHRYLYLLGNKTERRESKNLLRVPVLPYPKENNRNEHLVDS